MAASASLPVEDAPWMERFSPRVTWLLRWGTKGGLAVTDQALFAGAQFALNIMLARWLSPAEYGAFAVAYAVFLLASSVHSALLIEPMMVFGSGRYLQTSRSYLRIVLRGHWLLTAAAGVVLFSAGLLVDSLLSPSVGHALCALGIVLPFILLAWLTRRAFYIYLKPGRAAAGGAVFFCSLMVFACLLRAEEALTPATAIFAMGAAASLGAGLHLYWLRPQRSNRADELVARQVASEHWQYGRWVLAAALPTWALLNVYYLVLPIWFGLKSAGALKAIMNLAMPASQAIIAFGVLMIPLLVRHRDIGGLRLMQQTVRRTAIAFIAGGLIYSVLLWVFRIPLIHLLYGGRYVEYSGLPVLLVGLVPLVTSCSVAFGIGLRALERPDRLFWAIATATLINLGLGFWFAEKWSIPGALGAYLGSYAVFAIASWFLYQKPSRPMPCGQS